MNARTVMQRLAHGSCAYSREPSGRQMCVKDKMLGATADGYCDTNQWHWNPRRRRLPPGLRRDHAAGVLMGHHWRVPRRLAGFAEDRRRFNDLAALGHCQQLWDGRFPEWQPDFYADTTDPLPANEWPMVNTKPGCQTQRIFCCGG